MNLVAVVTTVAQREDADALARGAVEQRLAACVQLHVIESVYRWDGALQAQAEWRLLFKTSAVRAAELQAWLLAHHPYDLPAVYVLDVANANPAYADWVQQQTTA